MGKRYGIRSRHGLEHHGLKNLENEFWTLSTAELIERSVAQKEGILSHGGALVVTTGKHTGRSPEAKFFVRYAGADQDFWWDSNQEISPEHAENLYKKITKHFEGKDAYIQDAMAAAHPTYQLPIRVITEDAWHNAFARNLFIKLPPEKLADHIPQFTIINAPSCQANPKTDGTNNECFVVLDFKKRLILIGGTSYAGEIKKSIFTVLNYLLPMRGVLGMHCSANIGNDGNTALFFGLSGTGKTTLSADPDRQLIGDDEHGWGDDGTFNFEGGCYAKTIKLSQKDEPLIWSAVHRFGAILENVVLDPATRIVDFNDDTLTENTRGAYPIDFLDNNVPEGRGGHPNHIFFLTADAFGVMPPISKLSKEQAMYYFISGYTAKLAGTEKGIGPEPQATFSACFGSPFLPLHPHKYAKLLGEKIEKHDTQVWLINTGWTAGAFGTGHRISIPHTRALISAALEGKLNRVKMRQDPNFKVSVPESCPNVPSEILNPRQTWSDPDAYDRQAEMLCEKFSDNFAKYANETPTRVVKAGPKFNKKVGAA